jgi:GMP reductase
MRIISEEKLNIDDLLLVPQRNTLESRSQVNLEREYRFYHSPLIWKGIPVFCANMAAIAGKDMALALAKHKMCCALHKFHSAQEIIDIYDSTKLDDQIDSFYETDNRMMYIWPSIGMNYDDISKIKEINKFFGCHINLVIDVPNAYMEKFVKFCADVRNEFPNAVIMAGNVTTPEATQELIIHGGVDIVKVGIGPGSQCTTRLQTGVGYGTASSTIECAGAAHGLKSADKRLGLICADGGIRYCGDFAKNFALGADFCMAGGFFAGLEENCGEWERAESTEYIFNDELYEGCVIKYGIKANITCRSTHDKTKHGKIVDGKKLRLKMYGMSSKTAQEKHYGEYKKYRASEGRESYVDYRGTTDEIVQELLGSLRSTATYIGAHSLKDFAKCAVFCKINQIHPNMSL